MSAPSLYDLCLSRSALLLCNAGPADAPTSELWRLATDAMRHDLLTKLALLARGDVMLRLLQDARTVFRLVAHGERRDGRREPEE